MKGNPSPTAVVEGDDTLKQTASGPSRSAIRRIADAVRSRASSQLTRCQPGSGSPFGRVRRSGCVRRSFWLQSGEASVLDNGNRAAPGDAQPAKALDAS